MDLPEIRLRARGFAFLVWFGRIGLGASLSQAYAIAFVVPFVVLFLIDRFGRVPQEAFAVALGLGIGLALVARIYVLPQLLSWVDAHDLRRPEKLAVIGGVTITGSLVSVLAVLFKASAG